MTVQPEQRLDAQLDRGAALVLVVDCVTGAGGAGELGGRQALQPAPIDFAEAGTQRFVKLTRGHIVEPAGE